MVPSVSEELDTTVLAMSIGGLPEIPTQDPAACLGEKPLRSRPQ